MKIRPVEAEVFHADRGADGQADMKLIVGFFRNLANEPINGIYQGQSTVEPCYNDIGLYDASSIPSNTHRYQQIPHC